MDDHTRSFAIHRRMAHGASGYQGDDTVLDDAVDGRYSATADELTGRKHPETSSLMLT
jgi:hypothetical protein